MKFEPDYVLVTKPNIGKRVFAFIIDYSLVFGYFYLMVYFFGEPNNEGQRSVNGLPGFSIIIAWFIITIGLEQFSGSTLGNYAMKLKAIPIADPRKPIEFGQSIKRHLLDLIDVSFFGIVGFITIKNTVYNQRLGDLWAKTVVIEISD